MHLWGQKLEYLFRSKAESSWIFFLFIEWKKSHLCLNFKSNDALISWIIPKSSLQFEIILFSVVVRHWIMFSLQIFLVFK